MPGQLNVVTGATGLLGSHITEQLVQRGEQVRALVRPGSDVRFLQQLGVELVEGDLNKPDSLARLTQGADIVYHAAARVGDWGKWHMFQEQVVDATQNLLNACQQSRVGRFLYVSSITVYGDPREKEQPFTEEEPLAQRLGIWSYYCKAKILAEKACRSYPGAWTIIRPSWLYGPRDRTTLPRMIKAMQTGRVAIIGEGKSLLNLIYAGDVAEGAIRAANVPEAAGQVYNLSSKGEITQQELQDYLATELGLPRVTRRFSKRVAWFGGFLAEIIAWGIRLRRPPHMSRYGVMVVCRSTRYSCDKAWKDLDWKPRMPIEEGLQRTLEWYRQVQAVEAGT